MQQRDHFKEDILKMSIAVLMVLCLIFTVDHISVFGMQLVLPDRPDDKVKVSEMVADHFDKNNYFVSYGFFKIPKIRMCFVIAYHFIIALMIFMFFFIRSVITLLQGLGLY